MIILHGKIKKSERALKGEAGFSLGRLHMGGMCPLHMGGGQVQGDKALMGELMRGDIDLMGG